MPKQSGFYSWVCFIEVRKGAWFGPVAYDEIDDYEAGFAVDDNIKSWTEFTYYEKKPTDQLTCNFAKRKRVVVKAPPVPKTVTFAECLAAHTTLIGSARLLVYNATDTAFQVSLLEHDNNRKHLVNPGCPNRAEWRLNNEGYGRFLIKFWDAAGTQLIFKNEYSSNVPYDRHFTIRENATGYYLNVEEYC